MLSYQAGDVVVLRRRPYQLLSLMGKGGQGAVFEARDPEGALVAVKLVPALPRHRNEARILAGLQADHIVRLLDVGVSKDTLILVMERLEGVDLKAIVEFCKVEGRSIPLRIVVDCLIQASMALIEATQMGHLAFHRDIKPGNLVLERSGVLKLIDFGIAHRDDMVYTGSLIGTPENMAPEQVGLTPDWRVDVRTDLYCLGLVMYELIFLEPLHTFQKGMPVPERLMRVWQGKVEGQVARAHALSRPVGAFLHRAIQRDPSARFQTPRELLGALLELRGQLPECMEIQAFAACALEATRVGGDPEVLKQAFPLRHAAPTLSLELGAPPLPIVPEISEVEEVHPAPPMPPWEGPEASALTWRRLLILTAISLGVGLGVIGVIWLVVWLT